MEYSHSLSHAWQRQTLLNVVKLRYMEPPMFIDIGQIVSGYQVELSSGASAAIGLGPTDDLFALQGGVKYTDRPTITYSPLTGAKFIRALLTPLRPETLFSAIQNGFSAEAMFRLAVRSLNGQHNYETGVKGIVNPDPDFLRAIPILGELCTRGACVFRTTKDSTPIECGILRFTAVAPVDDSQAKIDELFTLLKLDKTVHEYRLVVAPHAGPGEIAIQTRSLLNILAVLAADVDIPASDLDEGRASPGFAQDSADTERLPGIHVLSAADAPQDAYVWVRHRNTYFYLDDRDIRSKRNFSLVMMLFTLAETSEAAPPPILTIPAN
jgi:hypothetical protein